MSKYTVIENIPNDAPYGDINWCSVSFLSPEKQDKTKNLDIIGLKIYNGYNSQETANNDCQELKRKNNNHDIYVVQVGKLYAWNDLTKTDSLQYDDKKLNALEQKRRENADKAKIVNETVMNEMEHRAQSQQKPNEVKKRLQYKLHQKGIITTQEYEIINKTNKDIEVKKSYKIPREEIESVFQKDYLDEHPVENLNLAIISIYSPYKIHNLKTLCFKIRGLFESKPSVPNPKVNKRVKYLQNIYPTDPLALIPLGQWCGFEFLDQTGQDFINKKLNFLMYHYLEHLRIEKETFEERKKKAIEKSRIDNELRKKQMEQDVNEKDEAVEDEPVPDVKPQMKLNQKDEQDINKIINFID